MIREIFIRELEINIKLEENLGLNNFNYIYVKIFFYIEKKSVMIFYLIEILFNWIFLIYLVYFGGSFCLKINMGCDGYIIWLYEIFLFESEEL